MALFARRRHQQAPTETEPALETPPADAPARVGEQRGPWDVAHAPAAQRVDLGSLMIPAIDGMQVRIDTPSPDQPGQAVALILGGSSLELRAFAAPRSSGIWDELRTELGEELRSLGATYQLAQGPYGPELVAQVPTGQQGETTPVRFIGVDGPRWFVRAALLGPAATDGEAAEPLYEVLADVVVVRGSQPRPPREVLPLHLPGQAASDEHAQLPGLDPLDPGPTIAEVR